MTKGDIRTRLSGVLRDYKENFQTGFDDREQADQDFMSDIEDNVDDLHNALNTIIKDGQEFAAELEEQIKKEDEENEIEMTDESSEVPDEDGIEPEVK
jgi:gas vesicle protein